MWRLASLGVQKLSDTNDANCKCSVLTIRFGPLPSSNASISPLPHDCCVTYELPRKSHWLKSYWLGTILFCQKTAWLSDWDKYRAIWQWLYLCMKHRCALANQEQWVNAFLTFWRCSYSTLIMSTRNIKSMQSYLDAWTKRKHEWACANNRYIWDTVTSWRYTSSQLQRYSHEVSY